MRQVRAFSSPQHICGVLVGSAFHNVHNTIKGCNTGTSWISADRDSKLGKFCVCSTVCMHADGADRSAMAFDNFNFRGFNFRAIFIFPRNTRKLGPREKRALLQSLFFWRSPGMLNNFESFYWYLYFHCVFLLFSDMC